MGASMCAHGARGDPRQGYCLANVPPGHLWPAFGDRLSSFDPDTRPVPPSAIRHGQTAIALAPTGCDSEEPHPISPSRIS